jgi:AraC family transcriptional regulator, positive regulator of tynA and feaB
MKTVQRWSTDNVEPAKRLHFWREAVHQSLVEMDLKPSATVPSFASSIEAFQLASIAPHQAKGSAQTVRRGRAEIGRGEKNAYYLLSQPKTPWRIKHAGHDTIVAAGQSVLVDSREAYEFFFELGLDDLSIEMPIAWIERWLPHPEALLGRPLGCVSSWGNALRGFKEALVPQNLAYLGVPEALLEDQLGLLLSLASGQLDVKRNARDGLMQRCIDIMRERIGEPELVAATIAAAAGISVRSLHRSFAFDGKSFATTLIELRVDEARRMLASRRFDLLTISEISRRCGFLDPSHFTRKFRASCGIGPRNFRMKQSH